VVNVTQDYNDGCKLLVDFCSFVMVTTIHSHCGW